MALYGKIGAEGDARKVSDTLVFLELLENRWTERTLAGLSETLRGILSDRELVGEYSAANLLVAAGNESTRSGGTKGTGNITRCT